MSVNRLEGTPWRLDLQPLPASATYVLPSALHPCLKTQPPKFVVIIRGERQEERFAPWRALEPGGRVAVANEVEGTQTVTERRVANRTGARPGGKMHVCNNNLQPACFVLRTRKPIGTIPGALHKERRLTVYPTQSRSRPSILALPQLSPSSSNYP